jgi:hypothetical protein
MDDITAALERAQLHRFRSYLLYGTEEYGKPITSYRKALETGSTPINQRLADLCPDSVDRDHAAAELTDALTVYQDVFMELGMKVGARLVFQLLTDAALPPAQ